MRPACRPRRATLWIARAAWSSSCSATPKSAKRKSTSRRNSAGWPRRTTRIRSSPARAGRFSAAPSWSRSPSPGRPVAARRAGWLVALFVAQFFRDPPRVVPAQANAVLSPADGRIVLVGRERDPVSGSRRAEDQRVHERVQRARQPQPGRRRSEEQVVSRRPLLQRRAGQGVAGERTLCAAPGHRAAGRHHLCAGRRPDRAAHAVLRRAGRPLARGQRYGFIRFGSRVDVYLPANAAPRVAVGDAVQATATIVAELA